MQAEAAPCGGLLFDEHAPPASTKDIESQPTKHGVWLYSRAEQCQAVADGGAAQNEQPSAGGGSGLTGCFYNPVRLADKTNRVCMNATHCPEGLLRFPKKTYLYPRIFIFGLFFSYYGVRAQKSPLDYLHDPQPSSFSHMLFCMSLRLWKVGVLLSGEPLGDHALDSCFFSFDGRCPADNSDTSYFSPASSPYAPRLPRRRTSHPNSMRRNGCSMPETKHTNFPV